MRINKVAYVNLIIRKAPGISAKLERQARVAKENDIPMDFYWISGRDGPVPEDFEFLNVTRINAKNPFVVRFYQALEINKLTKKYEKVLLRYPLYDPVLRLFIQNSERIFLEHHTKEVEELALQHDKRWFTERYFGARWIAKFGGLVAVTREILDYELFRSKFDGAAFVAPNSIEISDIRQMKELKANKDIEKIELLFVASSFERWHGLEEILEIFEKQTQIQALRLHLAGKMTPEQILRAEAIENVFVHGELLKKELEKLYSTCDVGLSSFRLDLKGLEEACTLKVREYLAYGLPVILGHRDSGLPTTFKHSEFISIHELSYEKLVELAMSLVRNSPEVVRSDSSKYIDTRQVTRALTEKLLN